MISSPLTWYRRLPAGVPDTGPFNAHFVRDIGCAYAAIGIALCAAAEAPAARRGVLLAAALFYAFHAFLHVADLLEGRLPVDHWVLDTPTVFVPALVMIILCVMDLRGVERAHS
jgi:hypothetical protein